MDHRSEGKARPRVLIPGLTVAILAFIAWGCEGDNLFAPGPGGPGAGFEVGPGIEFIQPEEEQGAAFGDSLRVMARVTHPDGVLRVTYDGVAHRGERDPGTHEMVQRYQPRVVNFNPPVLDTTLVRFVQPTGTEVAEEVFIRAIVEDVAGNVSRDSISITVGGPSVQVPDLASGMSVTGGQEVPIRVLAVDPTGVEHVRVEVTGVVEQTFLDDVLDGQDPNSVEVTFTLPIPEDVTGELTIRASARNENGIPGSAPRIDLSVVDQAQAELDETPPEVRIAVAPQGAADDRTRVEGTDPIRIEVTARDETGGSGVQRAGYTVRVVRRANTADTLWVTDTLETVLPAGGTVTRIFNPSLLDGLDSNGEPFYDPTNRPDTLDLDFFGWAEDAATDLDTGASAPNCAASVSATAFQQRTCETFAVGGDGYIVAAGETGQRVTLSVVSGQTVRLPAGGQIADAVVHTGSGDDLLILSNIGLSRLEVFDLSTRSFEAPILVGNEPWGLAAGFTDPDVLFVGNSGGTQISRVSVAGRSESGRVRTPNVLLWDVEESVEAGTVTFTAESHGFSDRPQFVAEDAAGRLVYSTRPTGAAPDGTIRLVDFSVGSEPAVHLFTGHGAVDPQDDWFAIGNVDRVFTETSGLRMRTHHPGERSDPGQVFETGVYSFTCPANGVCGALDELRTDVAAAIPGHPRFHPEGQQGRWDINSVGLTDTTFVSAAGDGSVVAIGEGATAQTGRIFLWRASQESITDAISVQNLVNNAAERVMGVAMNQDGQLGVGRGLFGLYFFDARSGWELQLLGSPGISAGGAGVALHPGHSGLDDTTPPHTAYAFAPVGNGSVEIFDSRNYFRSGRVFVRDTIVGPIRSAAPFAADNAGLTCVLAGDGFIDVHDPATDAGCVVVKLYGVSLGGGVAVIDVTKGDILRDVE